MRSRLAWTDLAVIWLCREYCQTFLRTDRSTSDHSCRSSRGVGQVHRKARFVSLAGDFGRFNLTSPFHRPLIQLRPDLYRRLLIQSKLCWYHRLSPQVLRPIDSILSGAGVPEAGPRGDFYCDAKGCTPNRANDRGSEIARL